MTVSTDWLEKIARALLVEPADLIGTRSNREIQLIGRIGERGRINRGENEKASLFTWRFLRIIRWRPVSIQRSVISRPAPC